MNSRMYREDERVGRVEFGHRVRRDDVVFLIFSNRWAVGNREGTRVGDEMTSCEEITLIYTETNSQLLRES